jgi:Sulfotransferase family
MQASKVTIPKGSREQPFDFQPIIVIGAARSGTNMLRDLLTALPGFTTWPCDEINPIWKHGNLTVGHDELDPSVHLRPGIRKFVRQAFRRQARVQGLPFLVEKTCANSLRVPFVDAAVPEARFIHIVRDGRDVVASAMKRWKAPFDFRYSLKKACYVPWTDIPYLAGVHCLNRIHRMVSPDHRLSSWGPRFIGMQKMLEANSLPEVCAWQWKVSVDKSMSYLHSLPRTRVHFVSYEKIGRSPVPEVARLGRFLGIDLQPAAIQRISGMVRRENSGSWRGAWNEILEQVLTRIMADTLSKCQYDVNLNASSRHRAA